MIDFSQIDVYKDKDLRPYQTENKAKIYKFWESGRSVMLQMPTGTGKTRLFVSIVKDLHSLLKEQGQDVKVLLIAHRVELIEQISDTLGSKYGLDHGVIKAGYEEESDKNIQVASIQTLSKRFEKWRGIEFDLIIIDEAHHGIAKTYKAVCDNYSNAKLLGVTATPYRLNGDDFTGVFEDIITSQSVESFIKDGWLCDYNYYSIPSDCFLQKSINSIDKLDVNGDYDVASLLKLMNQKDVRSKIIETYKKYADGKKGIVYTISREHNLQLRKDFTEAGYRTEIIDSYTNKTARKRIIQSFKNGDIDILCNVDIFSEGFDCPELEFIQLTRPTLSLALYLQQVGRGLRTNSNKDKVIFIDNVGLYNEFGVPSSYRDWRYYFFGWDGCADLEGLADTGGCKEVFVMGEYEEDNEVVELIHSSNIDTPHELISVNYEVHFREYLQSLNIKSSRIDEIIYYIINVVDVEIRRLLYDTHRTIFNIERPLYLLNIIKKIRAIKRGCNSTIQKTKRGFYSFMYPLNLYSDFLAQLHITLAESRQAQIEQAIFEEQNEHYVNSLMADIVLPDRDIGSLKSRTIEEIDSEILLSRFCNSKVEQSLLDEKMEVENNNTILSLQAEVEEQIRLILEDAKVDVSLNISYTPTDGLKVIKSKAEMARLIYLGIKCDASDKSSCLGTKNKTAESCFIAKGADCNNGNHTNKTPNEVKNKYSDEFKRNIAMQYYVENKTMSQLAEEYNLVYYTIRDWVRNYRDEFPDGESCKMIAPKDKYSAKLKAEIISLHIDQKIKMSKLSRDYNIPYGTVQKWIKKKKG